MNMYDKSKMVKFNKPSVNIQNVCNINKLNTMMNAGNEFVLSESA